MNFSTQSFQETVMQELAKLSEIQQEKVLSFIHSLIGNKLLTLIRINLRPFCAPLLPPP